MPPDVEMVPGVEISVKSSRLVGFDMGFTALSEAYFIFPSAVAVIVFLVLSLCTAEIFVSISSASLSETLPMHDDMRELVSSFKLLASSICTGSNKRKSAKRIHKAFLSVFFMFCLFRLDGVYLNFRPDCRSMLSSVFLGRLLHGALTVTRPFLTGCLNW